MIGKIYSFSMPFYDARLGGMSYKARPALIVYGPRNNDYTVLPVSTIKNPKDRDPDYDIKIEPSEFSSLGLRDVSYIRTHKQTVVHQSSKYKFIGDLRGDYPDKFSEVLSILDRFNQKIQLKGS